MLTFISIYTFQVEVSLFIEINPKELYEARIFKFYFEDSFFNVSLFHYRNYGHDFGRVLVGLQASQSKEDDQKLDAFLDALGYRYAEETSNATYRQFMTDEG